MLLNFDPNRCRWCSNDYQSIFHGGPCPKVKKIRYYPNGTVREVEFFDPRVPTYRHEDVQSMAGNATIVGNH